MLVLIFLLLNISYISCFECIDSVFFIPNNNGETILCANDFGDLTISGSMTSLSGDTIREYIPRVWDGFNDYQTNLNTCYYTKNNNKIIVWGTVEWIGNVGVNSNDNFYISLPFVSNSIYGESTVSIGYLEGVSYENILQAYVFNNEDNIVFYNSKNDGTISNIINSNVLSAGTLSFRISYYV